MEGITKAMVSIKGVSPMLMHNSQLANPLNEWTVKIKEITKKHASKKTDSDLMEVLRLEFQGGLYHDDEIGPFIPGVNIEGAIRDAARTSRQGKAVESGVVIDQDKIRLNYQGPRDRNGLFSDKRFVDIRAAKLQKAATVMRTRARFDQWDAEFEVMAINELVSIGDVERFLRAAGMVKGIGDYRPKFGRFVVTDFVVVE